LGNTGGNYSENCLTLNIARPANAQNLPVAVWIYGGAFVAGSSSMSSYNLSWFVNASVIASKPVITVSLNYRLMYFGFLAGSDLSAEGNTNMGLYDQRMALHWVKENIAAFGGDPSRITVFGESA
jgi:carboxylesterase type B